MPRFHILTQYIWQDAAPTGLYAEHLALRLQDLGCQTTLVAGTGKYRPTQRERPPVEMRHLEHFHGRRGSFGQTLAEYASVNRSFQQYVDACVHPEDVVICTSAPPNTVGLAPRIKRRGARAIYWLQDYYPELVRGVREYPRWARRAFAKRWDSRLAQWDKVVKIGANIGHDLPNAVVIRNWPTMSFPNEIKPKPKSALYLGNLGYGHDVGLFVEGCAQLRDQGYSIRIYADGPGVEQLPGWLKPKPALKHAHELYDALRRHKVHLVAAHPKIQHAIFPSKIWNSIAVGAELFATGFEGAMRQELEVSRAAKFEEHLDQWTELLFSEPPQAQQTLAAAA